MSNSTEQQKPGGGQDITHLYQEQIDWVSNVNTGGKTIHAKRMPGRFRTLKNWGESIWLFFFLGPYIRWDGHQAMMFDIPHRQFRAFGLTILPQDIWMVSLLLLLLAMVLFAAASVASRVFCGYFCFQSSWVDWFTWIEDKLEGPPNKRHKLDAAPWNAEKIRIKVTKHLIFAGIAVLTAISFTIWFEDAFEYWNNLLHFNLSLIEWATFIAFFCGTYFLAGHLREQTCMWLCPYARIQGVMADTQTLTPTYDVARGEPRGKVRKGDDAGAAKLGDCVDCFQCVQVCPTGVDIRDGSQLGCITCGLCIDACDSVMDKLGRPRGLVRYASLDEMRGKPAKKVYQHPRTWAYVGILFVALLGILWGLTHLGALELRVVPERQPLYVRMSDGSIQNKYSFKVLNKTDKDFAVKVEAHGDIEGLTVLGPDSSYMMHHGRSTSFTVFAKANEANVKQEMAHLQFKVINIDDPNMTAEYTSLFNGPKH